MPESQRPDMASYGVPTDLEGALEWRWASTRLEGCRNYWLTTVGPDHRPHSMPVWGIWIVDDERFWFSCAADALKARNIRTNPHVVVTTDDTVEVVSVEGVASLARGHADVPERYAVKYEDDPHKRAELAEFIRRNTMFEVAPIKAFGVIERAEDFATKATRWVW